MPVSLIATLLNVYLYLHLASSVPAILIIPDPSLISIASYVLEKKLVCVRFHAF